RHGHFDVRNVVCERNLRVLEEVAPVRGARYLTRTRMVTSLAGGAPFHSSTYAKWRTASPGAFATNEKASVPGYPVHAVHPDGGESEYFRPDKARTVASGTGSSFHSSGVDTLAGSAIVNEPVGFTSIVCTVSS